MSTHTGQCQWAHLMPLLAARIWPFSLHLALLSLPVTLICVHLFHSKNSWRIQAREDSNEDPSLLVDTSEHMFAFLYVPFSAGG